MQYNYETVSQREEIDNPLIANALDYLERHAKDFKYQPLNFTVFLDNNTEVFISNLNVEVAPVDMTDPENLNYWDDYINVPTDFFCRNVAQFYSYIKSRNDKAKL